MSKNRNWALDPRIPRYSAPGTRSDVQSVTKKTAADKTAAGKTGPSTAEEE